MYRGIGYRNTVDSAIGVCAHMGLHAKIPLVTFPGRTHFRIAFLLFVLRRAGRTDDRGIDYRAFVDDQPLLAQIAFHFLEQLCRQSFLFQSMAESQDGAFIRYRVQVNTDKLTHRLRVIEAVFRSRVAQTVPLLKKVNAQHGFQRYRWSTCVALWVDPLYRFHQYTPGYDRIHFLKKALSASGLLLVGVLKV